MVVFGNLGWRISSNMFFYACLKASCFLLNIAHRKVYKQEEDTSVLILSSF